MKTGRTARTGKIETNRRPGPGILFRKKPIGTAVSGKTMAVSVLIGTGDLNAPNGFLHNSPLNLFLYPTVSGAVSPSGT
jgi:hypothetical protein